MRRWGSRTRWAVALPVLLALTGCAVADAGTHGRGERRGAERERVTVLAAASLTDAFEEIEAAFEAERPDVDVVLGFGGSASLAHQVLAGAPADVLATASPATIALATEAGLTAAEPQVFAENQLEIAVPAGNPGSVHSLADFGDPRRTLALCEPDVPCGATAERALAAAGVAARPDTLERDARAALAKVRLGEVDAALVYRTDVLAAGGEVEGVPLPHSSSATTSYLLAVLEGSQNRAAAAAFTDLVTGPTGREILDDAGFVVP